jgi:hypothetical protein
MTLLENLFDVLVLGFVLAILISEGTRHCRSNIGILQLPLKLVERMVTRLARRLLGALWAGVRLGFATLWSQLRRW